MILILGLLQVHSFRDGAQSLELLAQGPKGEFRLPITQEQAVELLSQLEDGDPEDVENVPTGTTPEEHSPRVSYEDPDDDPPPLALKAGNFRMGAPVSYEAGRRGDL